MRRARVAAVDARGVVVRSFGGAVVSVPVSMAYGGREIATGRAPRRLGGSSRRVGAGLGVVLDRARAGQGGVGASQVPPRPLARVNMGACEISNYNRDFWRLRTQYGHGIGTNRSLSII